MAQTLQEILSSYTRGGELYEPMPKNWVQCFACGHRCKISPDKGGICKVRFNRGGKLFVPYGYAAGIQLDPVEKKPFYHFYPGSSALSFGMLGCDYHCAYCQNWFTSQTLRDPNATAEPVIVSAEQIVQLALQQKAKIVTSTYNEPLITSEWAIEIFKLAKQNGLATSYVSNGNGTKEVLDYIQPYIDAYKVDLKSFRQKAYSHLGGTLQNVLDTIQSLYRRGIWVEVVTLVIPGFNDSSAELSDIAKFIASVSKDIPWHVTAFHHDYKMTDKDDTTVNDILRAVEIGHQEDLQFVYAGNLPGRVGQYENTLCPSCGEVLVERKGFYVLKNSIAKNACCKCGTKISGRWQ